MLQLLNNIYNIIFLIFKILLVCLSTVAVLPFTCYLIKILFKNFIIKKKYRRENIKYGVDFRFGRCLEENIKRIYIIDEKNKRYRHIVDPYTLNELGFSSSDAPIKDNPTEGDKGYFSNKKYKIGERIKITDLQVDIMQKIALVEKFKELIK